MANKRNGEGYPDPTAFGAMRNTEKQEVELERRAKHLVGAMKWACDVSGFELTGRIQLRHKESGKEFR